MHAFSTKGDAVSSRNIAQEKKLSGQLKQHLQEICSKRHLEERKTPVRSDAQGPLQEAGPKRRQPEKKSSTPGVLYVEAKKIWVSTISYGGKKHHLGCFPHA